MTSFELNSIWLSCPCLYDKKNKTKDEIVERLNDKFLSL